MAARALPGTSQSDAREARRRPASLSNDSRCQRTDAMRRHRRRGPQRSAPSANTTANARAERTLATMFRILFRAILPSCLAAEGFWPAAGYSGFANPHMGCLVLSEPCSLIATSAHSRSVGRLNDRPAAAPCATRYERMRLISSSSSPILAGGGHMTEITFCVKPETARTASHCISFEDSRSTVPRKLRSHEVARLAIRRSRGFVDKSTSDPRSACKPRERRELIGSSIRPRYQEGMCRQSPRRRRPLRPLRPR
jgi:hypothetical protein